MRIGILTFHAQRNYGGVLQAWALQTAIGHLGHEAFVIDRDINRNNHSLKGPGLSWPLKDLCAFVIRLFIGAANTGLYLRCAKTRLFLRRYLNLTPYRFFDWKDLPEDHGLDVIVVGSDQVWHIGEKWGDPRPYFLKGAPGDIPAIAYAASFGMKDIPLCHEPLYREGFSRFHGISVRELEGRQLVEKFGFKAEHVVDPTLLIGTDEWKSKFGAVNEQCERTIAFYVFETARAEEIVRMCELARSVGWRLHVFVNMNLVKIPRAFGSLRAFLRLRMGRYADVLNVDFTADPGDFIRTLATVSAVVTDSFHGLMFASLFDKNVRVIKPRTQERIGMYARIEEYAGVKNLIAESLLAAVKSIIDGEPIRVSVKRQLDRIRESRDWLAAQLSLIDRQKRGI